MMKLSILLLLLVLSGCVVYGPGQYGSIEAFQAGQVLLSCETQCQPTWSAGFNRLMDLYASGQWQSLADSIMGIGYMSDLSYFFLGAAAEGLGYPDAALAYYQLSASLSNDTTLSHHCRNSVEGCGGIDLGALLPQKLAALSQPQQATVPLTDGERAELHNILYVVHAGEICSWPISPIVKDEINAYLDYYKQRLQYDTYNEEDSIAVRDISKRGKKICSSAKEKKRFADAVNRIVPFDKAHPEIAASMAAQPPQEIPAGTQGAVAVPYSYYGGFWWGATWYPAGYYDPYWRFYGVYPGPRYVFPPGHYGYRGYPGYWGGRGYYGRGYYGRGWYGGYRGHRW